MQHRRRFLIGTLVCFLAWMLATPSGGIPTASGESLLLAQKDVTIAANDMVYSDLILPKRTNIVTNYIITPSNAPVKLWVMNNAQINQALQGQQLTGKLVLNAPVQGTSSHSMTLDAGHYWVVIYNTSANMVNVSFRVTGSYIEN